MHWFSLTLNPSDDVEPLCKYVGLDQVDWSTVCSDTAADTRQQQRLLIWILSVRCMKKIQKVFCHKCVSPITLSLHWTAKAPKIFVNCMLYDNVIFFLYILFLHHFCLMVKVHHNYNFHHHHHLNDHQVCELWRQYLLQERVWQKAVEKFAQRWLSLWWWC